jgi:hypothetical protein
MTIKLGYLLQHSKEAERMALQALKDHVREAVQFGHAMRTWIAVTNRRTSTVATMKSTKRGLQIFLNLPTEEALRWEREISQNVQTYFAMINSILKRLDALNPPLRNEQIEPSREAILSERQSVMIEMDTLSTLLQALGRLKQVHETESALNVYS